jgi:hypothetical protein
MCAQVRLTNGYRVRVHVFVVYDDARELNQAPGHASGRVPQTLFQWPAVSRAQCKKGCQARGPHARSAVLQAIHGIST